jgi:hypothetical protein
MNQNKDAPTPTKRGSYLTKPPSSLPDVTEKALLHVLVNKTEQSLKFKTICDRRPEVFGPPSSDLRRKVQKRRAYLISNPDVFQVAIRQLIGEQRDLSVPESSQTKCQQHAAISPSPSRSSVFVPDSYSSNKRSTTTPSLKFNTNTTPLTSPPLPRNIMSHLDDEETGVTYQLHIEQFWKNPNGMLCIKGNEVVEDNTVLDKLSIMRPIFDMDDFDNKLYKACLTRDGDGIIITEPTIPGYLWKNPTKIQALVDLEADEVCKKTELTYKTIRMDMKKNRQYRTQKCTYLFPHGTTCNNEHFNKKNRSSSKNDLDTEIYVYEVQIGTDEENNEDIVQFCPFIVWRMAINGEGKRTDDDDDGVRGASKALARLGIKVGEKKSNAMDEDRE